MQGVPVDCIVETVLGIIGGATVIEDGVERPRITVTLATGISEAECRAVNLGYRDHRTINADDWRDREAEGLLLVPKAGETLFRLQNQKS